MDLTPEEKLIIERRRAVNAAADLAVEDGGPLRMEDIKPENTPDRKKAIWDRLSEMYRKAGN